MFCLTHLDIPVHDLRAAHAFFEDCMGFLPVDADARNSASPGADAHELDTGTVRVRLVEASPEAPPVRLSLEVNDIDSAVETLRAAGARIVAEPERIGGRRPLRAEARDPWGNTFHLWRAATEDDLEAPPELVTSREWHPEAEELMKSLLLHVPELFRQPARISSVHWAETLAGDGLVCTTVVVRGYVRATPSFGRDRLLRALEEHGHDPEEYAEYFNSSDGVGRSAPDVA